jgi:transketolase
VIDMFTIKPLDKKCVISCAKATGAIVTAENSNVLGGLGGAVAEVLSENEPVPLERVGVPDRFGEVGVQDYLKEKFGLTSRFIVEKAHAVIARK